MQNLIRQCKPEELKKVVYIQGEIDGSLYTGIPVLEEFLKQINPQETGESPAY